MSDPQPDQAHWRAVADQWISWASTPGHDAFWAYRAGFSAYLGAGRGRALEVGCGEGRISREVAKADPRLAARFDQLDLNKDGYLDKADRELRVKQMRDAWFAAADTNKDGQLSKAEFDAAKRPMHGGPRQGGPRDGAMPKPQR
ncbi:hypothetical protein G6F24_015363 [Rhizopus arrhizus]|nr:hypothetical protein G6F24_015363 [Rhizopus arrhizus]